MATKIVTKNSSTASAVPTASDLVQGELAVNVADKRLFTEDNGGSIIELGTNPSTIDINAGSIDGTAIGASSASTGAFTTLTATGLTVDTNTLYVDSTNNRVGIGTSSPAESIHTTGNIRLGDSAPAELYSNSSELRFGVDKNNDNGTSNITFYVDNSEKARIDSSGNLLVGTTDSTLYNQSTNSGFAYQTGQALTIARSGGDPLALNRLSTDGSMLLFQKDGTSVGSASTLGGDFIVGSSSGSGAAFRMDGTNNQIYPSNATGSARDNAVNLGASTVRWKDLYLSGGAYLGGTGSANKLDDYEEGTWTPSYVASGGGTITTGSNTGHYVKIGDFVFCSWRMRSTGVSGISGNIAITGFPFSAGSDVRTGGSVGYVRSWNSDMPEFRLYKEPSNTQMSLYKNAMNAGASSVTTSDFATGSDNNVLEASVVYKV